MSWFVKCFDEYLVSPQNSYVEALSPNVIVFGDGASGGN